MADSLDGRQAKAKDEPSAESVLAYIEQNPEIMASLFVPHPAEQPGVVDLQRHIVEGLRRSLEQRDARERQILSAAEARAGAVNRIHGACRTAIEAVSLDDLIARVARNFPYELDIDSAALVIESRVSRTRFTALIRGVDKIRLGALREAERAVLGERAQSVASIGLLLPEGAQRSILLLGSVDPHGFEAGHGTDLLEFLGEILAHGLMRWFQPPP